jgi:hypothetical protein
MVSNSFRMAAIVQGVLRRSQEGSVQCHGIARDSRVTYERK